MKIKTKIIVGEDYVLAAADQETINESWSLFGRILGRGKSALPGTGRALTAKIPNIAGLSKILSKPGNAKLIDDALIAAEKSNVPQLVATQGPKGNPLVFYVKPNGSLTTRLSSAEAAAVKAAGGKIPTVAGLGSQIGAKAATARQARVAAAAKAAQAGDEVLPGVFKTTTGFTTKLLSPSGKVIKDVAIGAPVKNMLSGFKNLVNETTTWARGARIGIKDAQKARTAALKAGKSPQQANKIFIDNLKASGVNRSKISELVKKARTLDRKAKKLGYNPQIMKGPLKNIRGTLGSKQLSVIQKITGIPKALIKDILISPLFWFSTVAGNIVALIVFGIFWGSFIKEMFGLGVTDADNMQEFNLEIEPYDTFIATLNDTETLAFSEEEIASLNEAYSKSARIISSKIKIIGESAILINEIRSQEELDKERKEFEKREGGPLAQQFNSLSFLSPAKVTHLFGYLMSDGRLEALRNSAEVDYSAFKSEMNSIYRTLRWGDALNMLLVGVAAFTPIFTLIGTILGKLFPDFGYGWFKLGIFDMEKYARDVASEFMSLNEGDWDTFIVPLTYQIMLEPGSNTVEGFSQKLQKYGGHKMDLSQYIKEPDEQEVIEKIEDLSAGELIALASDIPGDEVKAMVRAAR